MAAPPQPEGQVFVIAHQQPPQPNVVVAQGGRLPIPETKLTGVGLIVVAILELAGGIGFGVWVNTWFPDFFVGFVIFFITGILSIVAFASEAHSTSLGLCIAVLVFAVFSLITAIAQVIATIVWFARVRGLGGLLIMFVAPIVGVIVIVVIGCSSDLIHFSNKVIAHQKAAVQPAPQGP